MKDALEKAGVKIIKVSKNDGKYAFEILERIKDSLKWEL